MWINNTNLENDLHRLQLNEKEYKAKINTLEEANRVALGKVTIQTKVIERKVKQIEKVYVPQIQYIETFKGDDNASDCTNANSLIRNVQF